MARIKLITPEKSIAKLKYRVRITDINYGNHLGNDSLISILHDARLEWLTSMGYSELNIEGISLILNELIVNYQNESFYGDELEISISIGEVSSSAFEIYYVAETQRENKKILVAKAKTTMVCFDYQKKKVVALPEVFRQKIDPSI